MKNVSNFLGIEKCFLFGVFNGSQTAFKDEEHKKYNDDFEDFKKFQNNISKESIINYIEKLEPYSLLAGKVKDMFTNREIPTAGYYKDGDFVFPVEFLYYLKNYKIGIPEEYENYIKNKIA